MKTSDPIIAAITKIATAEAPVTNSKQWNQAMTQIRAFAELNKMEAREASVAINAEKITLEYDKIAHDKYKFDIVHKLKK